MMGYDREPAAPPGQAGCPTMAAAPALRSLQGQGGSRRRASWPRDRPAHIFVSARCIYIYVLCIYIKLSDEIYIYKNNIAIDVI